MLFKLTPPTSSKRSTNYFLHINTYFVLRKLCYFLCLKDHLEAKNMISRVVGIQTSRNAIRRGVHLKNARYYSFVNFPQGNYVDAPKPTLGQFKTALFHCFLIASTTYITLHTIWMNLHSSETEENLIEKTKSLEGKIQLLVDEKKNEIESKKKWTSILKFWK